MVLNPIKPKKVLNQAFRRVKPYIKEIEAFKSNLLHLIDQVDDVKDEENLKTEIRDFLKKTYYGEDYHFNVKQNIDWAIFNGPKSSDSVGVIIEAKRPSNKAEMVTTNDINRKAFHELMLYYLRERITEKNLEVRNLIITNVNEWFVFDAQVFDKLFAQNVGLVKQFEEFEAGRLSASKTASFYQDIAKPFVAKIKEEITFTHFDLGTYDKALKSSESENKIIHLYKIFSPEHLLKLPFANDSNSLNKKFYTELLHIIGLEETKEGGKKVIGRKSKPDDGSLLENTIRQLKKGDLLFRVDNPTQYGVTNDQQLFGVGLELVITWVNRILFLKLLEAQLVNYHHDSQYAFLNFKHIENFDDLHDLFFGVLARQHEERDEENRVKFARVPYLNSSLFEPNPLEQTTMFINGLRDERQLSLHPQTVLKSEKGKTRKGTLNTIEYLFEFLNAYDFSSEGTEAIQKEKKTLINASVLGLIFEKINGYKDGSFFTPGFITMYMCRETIRRAVVQKFNEHYGWTGASIEELYDKIEDKKQANALINSLKICDPAVGSGHFLVSALNEIIAIKSELKILADKDGKILRDYTIQVANDELIIKVDDDFFAYNPKSTESQRVQETLFHEKQTIIENCLFGVDINPNSVKICRLRLWIELLKSAYYKEEGKLETLPNIDINIKTGNSLISRFGLDEDLSKALKSVNWDIEAYKGLVQDYKHATDKDVKHGLEELINQIKDDFRSEIHKKDKRVIRKNLLAGQLFNLTQEGLFVETPAQKKKRQKEIERKEKELNKLSAEIEEIKSNKIYENAFEWRFEFPEVLDDNGDFLGFNIVIGNPPYMGLESFSDNEKTFFKNRYLFLERKYDTSVPFTILGLQLLAPKSRLTYIAPMTWQTGENYSLFRQQMIEQWGIEKIINLPFDIFVDAYVDTAIYLLRNQNSENYQIFNFNKKDDHHELKYLEFSSIPSSVIVKPKFKLILNPLISRLKQKWNSLNYVGLGTLSISTQGLSPSRFKKLSGRNAVPDNYIFNYLANGNAYNYTLTVNEIFLTSLEDKKSLIPFYEEGEKVLIRRIINRQDRLSVGFTNKRLVFKKDINPFIITNKNFLPKFILGVIASRFISFFYINASSIALKDDFRQTTLTELRELPIPVLTKKEQGSVVKKVDQVLTLKREDPDADTSILEAEIDQMVYKLYRLTKEEIKIVEGGLN